MASLAPARLQALAALLPLLLTGCEAAPRRTVVPPPAGRSSFPSEVGGESLWLEARLPLDQREVFALDLIRRGVLPVFVQLGTRAPEGTPTTHRLADDFQPRLYLQDGTPLAWIPPAANLWHNQEADARTAALGLGHGLLPAWDSPESRRFLFFELPRGSRIDAQSILVPHADHYRELELSDSLLELEVTHSDGRETLRAGLAPAVIGRGSR